jgi:methanogenic corrinoid protein MtbC1
MANQPEEPKGKLEQKAAEELNEEGIPKSIKCICLGCLTETEIIYQEKVGVDRYLYKCTHCNNIIEGSRARR